MKVNAKRLGLGAAAVVVVGTTSGVVANNCNGPATPLTPPSTISATCASDAGAALSTWLDGLPAGSTVQLAAGGCYSIGTTLFVKGTTGLSIQGNGARLVRTTPGGTGITDPLVELIQDSTIAISNLAITGAYNGTNGGGGHEGQYGIQLEADHGVAITGITMSNVQGDFITLSPPNDTTGGDSSLSTAVSIMGSTFTNCGYHGLTVESVKGLSVTGDTFTNMGVDAIDFEVDVYSTGFDSQGNPLGLAQDNVTISGNTWRNWQDDFFASLQGQLPGVQQQGVIISKNTLDAASPLFEVTGTNPGLTPKQYWNTGLSITNNVNLQAAISTHGSGPPGTESTMQIVGVVGLTIANNTLPLSTLDAPGPYLSVIQAFENQNMLITDNAFVGAFNIIQVGSSANTGPTPCGNHYGLAGATLDAACG